MNVRHSFRRLARSPGFTLTAVLSLALGIGANVAIFSLIDAVLLRDPPGERPEELVEVYRMEGSSYSALSYPEYLDLGEGSAAAFAALAGSQLTLVQLETETGVETRIGELVTGEYFTIRGLDAALGRTLLPEDDQRRGGHPVVVLAHRAFAQRYGGDASIVGREIRIAGNLYTVVGVAPREYEGAFRGVPPDYFLPIQMINQLDPVPEGEDALAERGNHGFFVKGRLAPGVDLARARATADAVTTTLREEYPTSWSPDHRIELVPTTEVVLFPPIDRVLRAAAWLLSGVAGLVLLVTCANLASFLLARAVDRRREVALRLAIGARRRDIAGQMLSETLLLAFAGGIAGLGVASLLLRALLGADLPLPVPITLDLGIDARVLLFSLAVTLVAGVAFGLAPAIQSLRLDIAPMLKGGGAFGGRHRFSLRALLVAAQAGVCVVLLVVAGLFLRSLQATLEVDPGFGDRPAAIISFGVPGGRSEAEGRELVEALLARFEAIPGVERAGITSNIHLNTLSTHSTDINVDGVEPPPGRESHDVDWARVDAGFFEAVGIPLLEGRSFNAADLPDSPQVAIVNRAFVRRFFADRRALGRRVRHEGDAGFEVVGVVRDAKIRTLGEAPRPFVYRPFSQSYSEGLMAIARTSVDPAPIAIELMRVARDTEPELWLWETKTMERHLGTMSLPMQLAALLLGAFAGLALLLASVGLYGLVSFAVARRSREVGIRISLGAGTSAVIRLLMGGGLRLVLVGAVAGLAVALAAAGALRGLLFGVEALDPVVLFAAPAALTLVAGFAAWLPARRATRIDPVRSLRSE